MRAWLVAPAALSCGTACGRLGFEPVTSADGAVGSFLDDDLVAHFRLDEQSGSSFTDATGNGRDGTCTACPSLGVAGKLGTAARFDGASVIVTADIGYGPADQVSIAAWVRYDGASCARGGEVECYVVAKHQFNASTPYNLEVTDMGEAELYVGDVITNAVSSGADIGDSNWHHIVGTFDGLAVSIYVDGALRDTGTGVPLMNADPVAIGGTPNDLTFRSFIGDIDDVRIYRRALTGPEVARLHAEY